MRQPGAMMSLSEKEPIVLPIICQLNNFLEIDSSIVILTRLHYLIAESFDISAFGSRVIDVSSYPDINQLYLIADLLITDYSSVMFDFALTKTDAIFMYDKEKYQNSTQGDSILTQQQFCLGKL